MNIRRNPVGIGEAAPWFHAQSIGGLQEYPFNIAGGRHVLMLFFGSAASPLAIEALAHVRANRALFDDIDASFYGVTVDPEDAAKRRIGLDLPGVRFFLDTDRKVSLLYGADGERPGQYQPHWLILDRSLRVVAQFRIEDGASALAAMKACAAAPATPDWAPVMLVPNVIEPDFCRQLIALYQANGGQASGVMRDVAGMTRHIVDPAFKVRSDYLITDAEFAAQVNLRLLHRLMPMVRRTFQFEATRVERLLVGCYDHASGGHFNAHRDDTTKGTAHRKFAVTINLNTQDYEGGDLRFPEFGPRIYRAPTGGAIVFSCSLLHQAMPVIRGTRYALLPFLYDEAGSRVRDENARFLEAEPAVQETAAAGAV